MLCDDLEGWDVGSMGGRLPREGIYVCIELGSHCCTAETTQQHKAIILQFFFLSEAEGDLIDN